MTLFYYEDVATKLNANMSATRPGTCDVVRVTDLSGTTLAVNFDVRIENEILRVTAIAVDTPSAGIDRWTVSHLGGAAASTHAAGQEVEVMLTAHALNNDLAPADDDSAYMPTAGGAFTGAVTFNSDIELEAGIKDASDSTGSDGDALKHISGVPHWEANDVEHLKNVVITSVADDDVLSWDSGTSKWVNEAVAAGSGSIATDSDVVITSAGDDDVLAWDSGTSKWTNQRLDLEDLANVVITSVADDDSLTWDSASSKWVNEAITGGGGGSGTVDTGPTLTAETSIPGLAGSPDVGAGGAHDDEFDYDASGTPTGWTSFGSPATLNTNNFKSHVHIGHTSNGGSHALKGILRLAGPSIPYTVTAKMAAMRSGAYDSDYFMAGLGVGDSATTDKVVAIAVEHNGGLKLYNDDYNSWTVASGTVGVNIATRQWMPTYFRMVVHSATNIDILVSYDGLLFTPLVTGINFLANATYVMLWVNAYSQDVDAAFDWIRFS